MQYKKDFPILNNKKLIYLDSSATSQKPKVVIDAVNDFYLKQNSNIHRGLYDLSFEAENLYEGTRAKVAKFIGVSKEEIVFTGNTTESINLIAFGFLQKNLKKGDIVVISEMEHHSNIVPFIKLKELIGIKLIYLPLTYNFDLDYQYLLKAIINANKVKFISLTHASNVLGTINPLEKIIPIFKKKFKHAYVLVDAAQSVPHIAIDVKALNCDFLAFSSHKMFGPSGVGVLFGKKELLQNLDPLFYGGHMIEVVTKTKATFKNAPEKFEAGTGKLEQVVGLGAAVDYLNKLGFKEVEKYEKRLTKYALSKLSKIKDLTIYGKLTDESRLPIFAFNIGSVHAHDAAEIFNRFGICVRSGNHCAQVLMTVLGVSSTLRASFSIYNTNEDIDKLVKAIEEVKKIFKV